jgi:hypothetical protein
VSDVIALVGIERDRDVIKPGTLPVYPQGKPLHVGMGPSHGEAGVPPGGTPIVREVAEVVLGVYDQQLGVGRGHM